jgi:hypothetical protein
MSRNRPGGRIVLEGRRVLDLAEGVLVGLRRYSTEAAFGELVDVAHRHDVTVSAVASALVALATGDIDASDMHPVEMAIAQHHWGDVLPAHP